MHARILAASAVAVSMLVGPASAESSTATVFEDFQNVCLNHRNDRAAQIAAARAGGYQLARSDEEMSAFSRPVDGQDRAVVVRLGAKAPEGATPAQAFVVCTVVGVDPTEGAAASLDRWAGSAPQTRSATRNVYYYKARDGRRTGLQIRDDAAMMEALRTGGYDVATIERKNGFTSLMLTSVTPQP
ncbi:MAG: hypothetical protein GC145_17180 [Caulobacter sp.]|nr:hypothetical protein [Caulobacter sp.]